MTLELFLQSPDQLVDLTVVMGEGQVEPEANAKRDGRRVEEATRLLRLETWIAVHGALARSTC